MAIAPPRPNYLLAVLLFAVFAATGTVVNAFSVGPSRARIDAAAAGLSMSEATEQDEELVTMRSLNLIVRSRPLGITLEEMAGGGGGVFVSDCDDGGAAFEAGIREGDVLAALDGDEAILTASLDGALSLIPDAPMPLPVRVYRLAEEDGERKGGGAGESVVKMSPRRLPSTRKLIRASTNANFWKDPVMIASAVLTVAMPLGIFVASSGGN